VWINLPLHIKPPKSVNFDIGLSRQFRVREAAKLEFRSEAFNVINHANLDTSTAASFHTALSDPKLGSITAAADPRILQGGYLLDSGNPYR
jgi:hypothetical protein